MKNLKRFLLVGLLCLSISALAACSKQTGTDDGTSPEKTQTEAPSETETEPESTEAETSEPETETLTEEEQAYKSMIEDSLVSTGNNYRLKKVMEKAMNGEDVYIAAIGGSITEGQGASPNTNCYAYQTYQAFAELFGTNGGENVHFINAGVSGTPSTLGLIRYDSYVTEQLGTEPDLVIVEFAVNDGDDPTNGDCYESLVRNILMSDSEPAVVLLFSVFQSQWNLQDRLIPVGEFYDLPMVSIKNAVVPRINDGTLTDAEFFSDSYHPTNYGHEIMADCMRNLFEVVAKEETAEADIEVTGDYCIGHSFEGIVGITSLTEDVDITVGSFSLQDTVIGTLQYDSSRKTFPNNWKHDTSSTESMIINVECKNFILSYKQSSSSSYGSIEVYVDGELVKTISGYTSGGWNNAYTVVLFNDTVSEAHTIEIKMAEGDEDKDFTIMAMGYTE